MFANVIKFSQPHQAKKANEFRSRARELEYLVARVAAADSLSYTTNIYLPRELLSINISFSIALIFQMVIVMNCKRSLLLILPGLYRQLKIHLQILLLSFQESMLEHEVGTGFITAWLLKLVPKTPWCSGMRHTLMILVFPIIVTPAQVEPTSKKINNLVNKASDSSKKEKYPRLIPSRLKSLWC